MMATMMKPIAIISSSSSRRVSRRVSCSSSSLPSSHIRRPLLSFPSLHPRSQAPCPSSSPSPSPDVELHLLLDLLPPGMRAGLDRHGDLKDLVEVVMDLGRRPLARFPSGDLLISDSPVEAGDLRYAVSKVGDFSDDNRSGLDRSLHRISAIRNRKMQIIGLTCRVGRAVSGSARMIGDLVRSGFSILVIGPPGVGKTTLIREIARLLADEQMKRVVIVDTSNEIGGDGDIPHSGIGRARRMQVPNVNMQHDVMIEAVENHMPEVIVIDEIGTELEAMAASTIAQRGVQLVATAHGVTIGSIMKNPSLQILVGGIESVTLGDEEARKRKVRKTILERKGPPTFTCAVEMISKTECRIHHKLESTVDAILAGKTPCFEVRCMGAQNDDFIKDIPVHNPADGSLSTFNEDVQAEVGNLSLGIAVNHTSILSDEDSNGDAIGRHAMGGNTNLSDKSCPTRVYVFKIREADLLQVAEVMGLESEIDVTEDIGTANAILVSYSELKQNPWIRSVAKFYSLLVFVIKKNTMAQMVKAVQMILKPNGPLSKVSANRPAVDIEIDDDAPTRKPSLEELDALEEVRMAIEYIVIPSGEPVELLPRCSEIIARQLELVESYQLAAELSGTEFNSRLQILPQKMEKGRSPVGHTTQTRQRS